MAIPIYDDSSKIIGDSGDNDLIAGNGDQLLSGNAGNDYLFGGAGRDYLLGGAGRDILQGSQGDDYLFGGPGDDFVSGGNDNDYLDGGLGSDAMKGGRGADVFAFIVSGKHLGDGVDTIEDFVIGEDIIQIEGGSTANVTFTDLGSSLGVFYDGTQIAVIANIAAVPVDTDVFFGVLV